MNLNSVSNDVLDKINNARTLLELPLLINSDSPQDLAHTHFTEVEIEAEKDSDNGTAQELLAAELDKLLESNDLPSDSQAKKNFLLDKSFTSMDVRVEDLDEKVVLTVLLYCHHLSLENLGPFIDGDLVIQGTCNSELFGPALCLVEHTTALGVPFEEITTIAPWTMMMTPAADNDGVTKFIIPISIGPDYDGHIVRVQIFVDDMGKIPYEEERSGYDMSASAREKLKCAISFQSFVGRSSSAPETNQPHDRKLVSAGSRGEDLDEEAAYLRGEAVNGGGTEGKFFDAEDLAEEQEAEEAALSNRVVKEIRIAYDYDDVMTLQAEGFELVCTQITPDGPSNDQEHLWKFHVLASYIPADQADKVGVEDITWIKCLKSLGTLPALPFFEILHDFDLSEPDDDCSIYIAVKTGPNPRFKKLIMISSLIEYEEHFTAYISKANGAYRPAPTEVSKAFGGPCGILLLLDGNLQLSKPNSRGAATGTLGNASDNVSRTSHSPATTSPHGGNDNDYVRGGDNAGSDLEESDEDEDEEEDYEDEEDIVAGLMQQISELESEKMSLSSLNMELQKKAVALMMREKSMQGQTAARTAPASEGGGATATAVVEQVEVSTEHNQEKDKQYQDTLHLIVEDRVKLNDQLKEFDQLALDLQTRLDDKELKFNGIDISFKKFKKEILLKAENSRTGHNISKKQIKQFEASEQKHEEDLEKVRLRNISLRTTYRKLERTLRAREQLAEGLHMIDFEQLKIENQTLNEKIEERNEELAKLKRKKTTTVQVLTHVREKLRFIEQANKVVQMELSNLEIASTSLRNIVTSDKLQRDAIRMENNELKAKQGFASSNLLLEDYEKRRNKVEQLKASVAELKDRYGILMRQVNSANTRSTATPWNVVSGSQTLPLLPPAPTGKMM